jgi:dCTP deaminase
MNTSLLIDRLYNDIAYTQNIRCSLEEQLMEEVHNIEYLPSNAEEFASFILKLISIIEAHLKLVYYPKITKFENIVKEKERNKKIEKELFELEKKIFELTQLSASLTPYIKFIYGSSSEKNPWGLIGQIDRLCRALNSKSRVIIRPRWLYEFSFSPITEQIQKYINDIEKVDPDLYGVLIQALRDSPYFFSLSYPPTSPSNLIHMAIWSHEIGHMVDHLESLRLAEKDEAFKITGFLSKGTVSHFESNIDSETMQKIHKLVGIEGTADKFSEPIATMIQRWAPEIFADLFSIRMFGPAAILSAVEFVTPIYQGLDTIIESNHPSFRIRLHILLNEYKRWYNQDSLSQNLPIEIENEPIIKVLDEELGYLTELVKLPINGPRFSDSLSILPEDRAILNLFYPFIIKKTLEVADLLARAIDEIVEQHKDCFLSPKDFQLIFQGIRDLRLLLPPIFYNDAGDEISLDKEKKYLALVVNAGWLNWLSNRKVTSRIALPDYSKWKEKFAEINILLLKSIENFEVQRWFNDRSRYGTKHGVRDSNLNNPIKLTEHDTLDQASPLGGILSNKELEKKLRARQLKIRPLLDIESQIGTCSVDLRLSNEFIVIKHPAITKLDPIDLAGYSNDTQYQSKIYLPYGKPFTLHPGQFALGSTLEYIAMPEDVMGLVLNRASWSRLGLVIASTYKVIPSFKGCITLELTNLSNVPILLYPCSRICQIIFSTIH